MVGMGGELGTIVSSKIREAQHILRADFPNFGFGLPKFDYWYKKAGDAVPNQAQGGDG
jgi:hypothetical protein